MKCKDCKFLQWGFVEIATISKRTSTKYKSDIPIRFCDGLNAPMLVDSLAERSCRGFRKVKQDDTP